MSKQMPEEQVVALRAAVEKFDAIQGLRGKLDITQAEMIREMIETSPSPTACMRVLEERFRRIRILTKKAAQLWHAGHRDAFDALIFAMRHLEVRLPYESTCPCPKVPVTLLMFEPAKTLAFFKWLVMGSRDDLFAHFYCTPTAISTNLFRAFPEAEGYVATACSKRLEQYSGLERFFQESVYAPFRQTMLRCAKSFGIKLLGYTLERYQYNDRIFDCSRLIPCCVFVADQKEVLKCFDREQQQRIATWEFQVPNVLVSKHSEPRMEIGLHPENEHELWRVEYPDWCSLSVQAGMGAMVLSRIEENELGDDENAVHKGNRNNPPAFRFKLIGRDFRSDF